MGERGTLRALRVAMCVVIVIEVPLYLVWLVRAGRLVSRPSSTVVSDEWRFRELSHAPV